MGFVETIYGIPIDVLIWVLIAVVMAVIEVATVGFFFIFFGVGALLTAIVSYFTPGNLLLHIVVFTFGSILMLVIARPALLKRLNGSGHPVIESNAQGLPGQEVLVIEPVLPFKGRVKVVHTGEMWTAYLDPEAGVDELAAGQVGVIVKVDGAKLAVRPK